MSEALKKIQEELKQTEADLRIQLEKNADKKVEKKLEKKKVELLKDSDHEEKLEKIFLKLNGIEENIQNREIKEKRLKTNIALEENRFGDVAKNFPGISKEYIREAKEFSEITNYEEAFSESLKSVSSVKLDMIMYKAKEDALKKLPENSIFRKALLTSVDSDGGFLVPPYVEMKLIMNLYETSMMRMVADVTTTSTDRYKFLIDPEDTETNWELSELSTEDETKAFVVSQHEINQHEQQAQPQVSLQILEDGGIDVQSHLMRKVADKFARQENFAFIKGEGNREPKGLKSYVENSAGYDASKKPLAIEGLGYGGTLDLDDISDLESSLIAQYKMKKCCWLISRKTKNNLRKLKDSNGQYLLSTLGGWGGFAGLKSNPLFPNLLGFKVYEMNDLDEGTSVNDVPVYFGDFSNYKILDRIGLMIIRDNLTKKGFVKYFTRKRCGAGITLGQGIKALKKTS